MIYNHALFIMVLFSLAGWAGGGVAAEFVMDGDKAENRVLRKQLGNVTGESAETSKDTASARLIRNAVGQREKGEVPEGGEQDEDVFSPRAVAIPGDGRNAQRAREYRDADVSPTDVPIQLLDQYGKDTEVFRVLEKARRYQEGKPVPASNDGLPLVDCPRTNNVAAQIGDDEMAQTTLIMLQAGKPVKVRCKKQ